MPTAEFRCPTAVRPFGGAGRPAGSVAAATRSGVRKRTAASAVRSSPEAVTCLSEADDFAEGLADGPAEAVGV